MHENEKNIESNPIPQNSSTIVDSSGSTADNGKKSKFTFEERQRLLGFFSILLKVDKRINPDYYKPKQNNDNESDTTGAGI